MFDQYCIPQLLLSSYSINDLQEEDQSTSHIKELLEVQKQTQLIQKIYSKFSHQQKLSVEAETFEQQTQSEFQTSIMKRNDSTISILSLSCDLANFSFTHQDRFKFGSDGSKCLKEVKDKCSLETYQYLSKIVEESRKQARSSKPRQKDIKRIYFLQEQKLILQHQLQNQKQSIEELREKVQKLARENIEISKKVSEINAQQKRLLKKQESLLYQRKICSSLQKWIRHEMTKLEELYESMESKSDRSFGSNPQGLCEENQLEKEENQKTLDYGTLEGIKQALGNQWNGELSKGSMSLRKALNQ